MGIFNLKRSQEHINKTPAKVVSVLNQKGGVGKTTMTFNLAHALAKRKYKVLCLDLDPQANLTYLFNQNKEVPQYNIFHLLLNSIKELKAFHSPLLPQQLVCQKMEGLDFIGSGQDLSGFELSVAGLSSPRQLILKKFLEKSHLLYEYDYILIDGPPTLGLIVVNILCASSGVLVPFQADSFSRKGLEHFHEVVEDIEQMGIVQTPKIIGYIPNLVDARRKNTEFEINQIKKDIGGQSNDDQLFTPFLNKVQLVKAQAKGKSVYDFQSKEFDELKDCFNLMAEKVECSLN